MPGPWLHRPEYWELSDHAHRVLVHALQLSAEQGTDGRIGPAYLGMLHRDGVPDAVADELIGRGHWERTPDGGYQIIDWAGRKGQSLAADVEAKRARKRANQAAYRARVAALAAKESAGRPPQPGSTGRPRPAAVTGHGTSRVTGNVGKARRGTPSLSITPKGCDGESEATSARSARASADRTPAPEPAPRAAPDVAAAHAARARADLVAKAQQGRLRLLSRTGQRIHVHPAQPYMQAPLPLFAEAVPAEAVPAEAVPAALFSPADSPPIAATA